MTRWQASFRAAPSPAKLARMPLAVDEDLDVGPLVRLVAPQGAIVNVSADVQSVV